MRWWSFLVRLGLFCSAFLPALLPLIAISLVQQQWWVAGVEAALVLLSLALLGLVRAALPTLEPEHLDVVTTRPADDRLLQLLGTYLVPIAVGVLAPGNAATLAAPVTLLFVLGLVYIRAELFHLNPTLAMLGFRIYEVTLRDGSTRMLLTRAKHLPQVATIEARLLSERVAIQLHRREAA